MFIWRRFYSKILIFTILLYFVVSKLYDHFQIKNIDDKDGSLSNSKIFCMIMTEPKNLNNKVWLI